ncbi:MAG: small nuclear ribonucleoprotein (Sm) [Thermoprotei archaeon ex4572_64]|nr:MAG: small nuclear ribonucleoprotein (Sm) [Thermoprotei archaeon ex4572_64]
MSSRCIDTINEELQKALNKFVFVKLRGGTELRGRLRSYDSHMNLLLEDAEEVSGKDSVKRGVVFVRGDTVLFISPVE